MIYLNYKKNYARQLFCLAFAATLTIVLLAFAGYTVKSQRVDKFKPSPFKFNLMPAPEKDKSNNISAPLAPGNLDPTFGTNGKLTTDFSSSEVANAVAVQADGKIVVAGSANTGGNYDFAVFRYNTDGSRDTAFDTDGVVTTPMGNENDYAYTVAIQTDGKIVVAGTSDNTNFALVRYNADGSLDSSFGTGGKVVTVFSDYSAILEIAIQADGKIVAAGYSINDATYYDFTLARYNLNGSLDASFGMGGIVTTDFFGGDNEAADSVAVQADGKIVAAGGVGDFGSSFALARYNTDGSLDNSFDLDGKIFTNFDGYSSASAVAIQTDGKIVAAGYSSHCVFFSCSNNDFAIARYNSNGSLDNTFDTDGKVLTDFGSDDFGSSVALQSNGKIVAAGYSWSGNETFDLARYNMDGSLDTSFDADGKVTTDFGGSREAASDCAVQADGKIIAAGYTGDYLNNDLALSRYNADGSLDTTFSGDGKLTASIVIASSVAKAVAIQDDGAIILAGYSTSGANTDFAVARYYGGSLDTSFKKITPIGNLEDVANAVAIQADGKIVAAGYSNNGTSRDFALVRYNADGSLDATFDGDGKVITDLGAFDDEALAVAIQADGKIIAVGYSSLDNVLSFPTAIVRYNADGSLDTSFGTNGKVIIQSVQSASSVVIQPDGKIVVAGYYFVFLSATGRDFALARFNTNGSLDTTFDGDGVVTTHFGDFDGALSVALQADGKIIAAGWTHNQGVFDFDFALARYNPNGSLDTSFDADGKVITAINSSSGAYSVGVQRNGKIVAAGSGNLGNPTNRDFTLVRYNANGSLDTSFDGDGKLATDFFGGNDDAYALAIERGGRIVAAGYAVNGTRTDFAAARYMGDPVHTKFDFDGDARADISVFRPTMVGGTWYVMQSSTGRTDGGPLGVPSDKIVPADYDGDGRTDIAQFNSSTGTWYLNRSQAGYISFQFGTSGDIPVPSDFDGDSKDDVAVYRPSTGIWWIIQSSNGAVLARHFGVAEDKPVAGDYDGDGRSDIAVYRPSQGVWHILQSSDNLYRAYQFGISEDKPIVGDYDGDGKNDLAVYRPSTNVWYVLRSTNGGFFALQFGFSTDIQTPADYDGDGKADIAVFRPSNGVWYVLRSSNGSVSYTQFGLSGDVPTPSAFIP